MKKFTLIELLIILVILSILISILLPSIQKAREATKNAVCISNTKQFGHLLYEYTQEKNTNTLNPSWARHNRKAAGQLPYYRHWEFFANGSNWHKAIDYVQSITCPVADKPNNIDTQNPYSISRHIQLKWLAKIEDPSTIIALGEKRTDNTLPLSVRYREETDDRHFINKAQSNVLLIDGHVESGNYLKFVDQSSGPRF